ncbi:hypothetical protein CEG18_28635 [Pseudomonas nitroreducens]|uniref:Uncharacterized protein n=1 Tax=Pseudomonas nitroreducens TaxID=46680 RepID=A0A246F371_PSENT|nr:hypothetical protein CEG18_28635 [Pseudomonas nitroreducens]
MDAHDEKVICDIFSKKENSDYLASSMLTQKIFGGMFWVLFGLFAFMAARALLIARQADELFKRAALHPVLQQQLPF